jgi:hypothetical protein
MFILESIPNLFTIISKPFTILSNILCERPSLVPHIGDGYVAKLLEKVKQKM